MNLFGMADSEEILSWINGKGVEPLYLMVSGSHACGLARPDSDLDIRGVYMVSQNDTDVF
jgi:predicted nucleotidyltransferase